MEKVARLSGKERKELFSATAAKKGVIDALIEKDFWVCMVLKAIFKSIELKELLFFKGGTSLSKVYNIINRFSEDVDVILDWRVLGVSDEEAWAERSATQRDKFNAKIDSLGRTYIADMIIPCLDKILVEMTEGQMRLSVSKDDGNVVLIQYPVSFTHTYLLDHVKLEIGPRASRVPHETAAISSYTAQEYPHVFDMPMVTVKTITGERTFWEKATILHQIAYFPESKPMNQRSSRHYYDVFQMAGTSLKVKALDDLKLLQNVAEFKNVFYRSPAARYDLSKPGTFKLVPSAYKQKLLAEDYERMREMIFGKVPDFSVIIQTLETLEDEINDLKTHV